MSRFSYRASASAERGRRCGDHNEPDFAKNEQVIVVNGKMPSAVLRGVDLLPYDASNEVFFTKYFVAHLSKVEYFVVVDCDYNCPIISEEIACQPKSRIHHRQPVGVKSSIGVSIDRQPFTRIIDLI